MGQDINSLLTGLATSLDKYMGLGVQSQIKQGDEQRKQVAAKDLEVFKADLDLNKDKSVKLYDAQLGELRDLAKHDRTTVPFSLFQGKGIAEAENFRPDDRIQIDEAVKFFKDLSKDKKDRGSATTNSIRGDFLQNSKQFAEVAQSTQRVISSASDPSAAGDLSLIFNYMKILDPGSVVREGEFATAQNSAGVPDRLRAQYNKVISGERLAPETRKDFLDRALKLYEGQDQLHTDRVKSFTKLSSDSGIDPKTTILDLPRPKMYKTPQEAEAANLPKGTVIVINGRPAIIE
jgi:hypothetical protein